MKKKNLIIIAHPDDEAIFFGNLLSQEGKNSHVICVTDANADGLGHLRKKEFIRSMKLLKVDSFTWVSLPDQYNNELDQAKLLDSINATIKLCIKSPNIYTHGLTGEYGHPHHLQISNLIHQNYFKDYKIYHPNYFQIRLTPKDKVFLRDKENTKTKILTKIYRSEYIKFGNLLPNLERESFIHSEAEVSEVSSYLLQKRKTLPKNLGRYNSLKNQFQLLREIGSLERPF